MKLVILFTTFWVMFHTRELVGTFYSNNYNCYSCISSSSTYWCAKKAYSASGYCCDSGESKSDCLGSDYQDYVCSNEDLPGRAHNLLCPQETSICEDTSDFRVTRLNQGNRVDTGIVGPGKTCDYRTYLNNTISTIVFTSVSSSSVIYNVTVTVDYVWYYTYLGVYKYFIDSNSYELVREVGEYFYGNITTTMDSNTEIYVQMHPFSTYS